MKSLFLYCLASLIFLISYGNVWAYATADCKKCHKQGSKESNLHISIEEFEASIHGREIGCQDCHVGVKDEEHKTRIGSGTVNCRQCHKEKNGHGLKSESRNLPLCHSCHTKHAILGKDNELSSVHPGRLNLTCRGCHPVESGVRDYMAWLPSIRLRSHNKQDFGLAYEKDNCVGCHQGRAAHGEEGPIDEQRCYACHFSPKGQSALWGFIHPRADFREQPAVFVATCIYFALMAVLLWKGLRLFARKLAERKRG